MKFRIAILLMISVVAVPAASQTPGTAAVATDRSSWPKTLDTLEKELTRLYVFPDVAASTVRELRRQRRALLAAPTAAAFAKDVQAILSAVTKDVHLAFLHDPEREAALGKGAEDAPDPYAGELNSGFVRFEVMPGNIGYWRIDRMVAPAGEAGEKAAAAMRLAAEVDALIIDLRHNPGGSGEMNQMLSSYFFAPGDPKLLVTNENRSEKRSVQEWTQVFVPGKHLPTTPIYFLVSPNTGSAAEGFAYNVRALGRAKVVGSKSAGAAHSGDLKALGGGFVAFIPSGRTINPVSKSNWEQAGVPIDIPAGTTNAQIAALHHIWGERAATAAAGTPAAERATWYLTYYRSLLTPPPARTDLADLVGDYGEDRQVRMLGTGLYLGRVGRSLQFLRPLDDGSFVLETSDYYGAGSSRWRFRRDGSGKVIGIEEHLRANPGRVATFYEPRRS